ncbi:MAG: ABC transporter ATP-binding protein [Spirochaetota bacterium]
MAYALAGLSKSYGSMPVVDDLSLEFHTGSVTAILGPSGCGKTSILNILAGLDPDFSGSLRGFGKAGAAYVFQEDRLMPWMSAAANVEFVLRPFMEKEQRAAAAQTALEAVGLAGSASYLPDQLSGGMRRRVALARALAFPSKVLLLDEPFSALDLKTRISVMDLFLDLRQRDGRTAIVVTHDVREAIYLGDSIAVLSERPARLIGYTEPGLQRSARGFASPAAATVEVKLYETILGFRTSDPAVNAEPQVDPIP